jgi:hypothetical protein
MNNSLNGQYTCFIDHQPIVSYSLETDRGKEKQRLNLFKFFLLESFVYGDVSSTISNLSRRKFRISPDMKLILLFQVMANVIA